MPIPHATGPCAATRNSGRTLRPGSCAWNTSAAWLLVLLLAAGARDLPQALTHELVHVLTDSGDHSEEPRNLMRAETSPRNTRLTAAQCERLRSRGEAAGLLTR